MIREAGAKRPGLMKYLNAITEPGSDPRLIQKLAARARSALHR